MQDKLFKNPVLSQHSHRAQGADAVELTDPWLSVVLSLSA